MKKTFTILAVLLLAAGCNHIQQSNNQGNTANQSPENAANETPIEKITTKSTVVETVPVYQAPGTSFSVYLPANYDSTRPTPLMVFFDHMGEGAKVLEKYKALGEKYGYVLACSKSTLNNSSIQSGVETANSLLSDLVKRFNVDTNRIIFAGLNSGAKIAIDAACSNPAVDAVVYTGGVLLWGTLNHKVSFLAIAGTQDVNYSEILGFSDSKYLADKDHYIFEWNGKNEWPDAAVFENAFVFPYSNISSGKLVVMDANRKKALENEKQLRQAYYEAITKQNAGWWSTQVADINARKKTDATYQRLTNLISLSCYKLAQGYLASNDVTNAEKVIAVYKLVDPKNTDCAALEQQLQAKKKGV